MHDVEMKSEPRQFTRQQLYEAVWQRTANEVAKSTGVSGGEILRLSSGNQAAWVNRGIMTAHSRFSGSPSACSHSGSFGGAHMGGGGGRGGGGGGGHR